VAEVFAVVGFVVGVVAIVFDFVVGVALDVFCNALILSLILGSTNQSVKLQGGWILG
jgi:hypothetical protein